MAAGEAAGGTRNEIAGGVFVSAVIQGRDISVRLPPAVTPALGGLPAPSSTFAGRDEDVQALLSTLDPERADATAVLVWSVAGFAGIGKTELALQVADRAVRGEGWFPGGVLFADMFGYDDGLRVSPEEALDGLLRALGMPGEHIPPGLQDRSRLYASILTAFAVQGQRILVVIDNVSAAEQAKPLLPTDGINRALVTSRHTLAGLGARLHDLDVLDSEAAVDLLRQVLQQARGDIDTRVADDPKNAAAISKLCGYLPLALQIVSALLADQPFRPLASLAADLADAQTRLDELQRENLAVRAAFDLSYRRLTSAQARAFRLMSLLSGADVSTETVAVLLGQPRPIARRLLGDLARAHLIDARPDERWGLHDLIRLYADEHGHSQVIEDGRAAALDRVLEHFVATTTMATRHLQPSWDSPPGNRFAGRAAALAWLDAEHENLVAAVEAAYHERRYVAAWRLPLILSRYMQWRQHLQDWLTIARTAVRAAPELGTADSNAQALSNLGAARRARFERSGHLVDLERAIEASREAVDRSTPDDPNRHGYLSGLGVALRARFERTGNQADLAEALQVSRISVQETPADHPYHAEYLSNLGAALRAWFRRAGGRADLDEAIHATKIAVEETPDGHPDRAGYLSNLGAAYLARFERTGDQADLDVAIEACQAAVDASPDDHPDRAGYLSNLGAAYRARFERTGDQADLDVAIEACQAAVDASPDDHPDRAGYLSNLGAAYRARFERTGDQADLDVAIEACQAAVAATPADFPVLASRKSNLSAALRTRFDHTGDRAVLNAAIETCQAAVDVSPDDHPDRARYLSNLGAAYLARYERRWTMATGLTDLDKAIEAAAAAVKATPSDHYDRATYLSNLGNALRVLGHDTGNTDRLVQASDCFAEAAHQEQAPAWLRIEALRSLAELSLPAGKSPEVALAAVEGAVSLLPQVTSRALPRTTREYRLVRQPHLAV